MRKNLGIVPWVFLCLDACLILGCNATNSHLVAPSVTPLQAVLLPGQTVQFSASKNGASILNAQWSVNNIVGGTPATGIITAAGFYTAPANAGAKRVEVSVTDPSDKLTGTSSVVLFDQNHIEPGVISPSRNPQVALYALTLPMGASMQVEFGTTTGYGLTTWTRPAPDAGGVMAMFVAGMRGFTTYHMRGNIVLPDGTKVFDADHTFTTGGLSAARRPHVTVNAPGGLAPGPGIELLDMVGNVPPSGPVMTAAYDLEGNLIWYTELPDAPDVDYTFPIKLLPNGNFLLIYTGNAAANGIREINLAGDVVSQFTGFQVEQALQQGNFETDSVWLHHDILPLPNGHLILLASTNKTFADLPGFPGNTLVPGDVLIEVDETFKPVWFWSTFDHLDINHHPFDFPDWTHANAVLYSPDDGNLILSMRNQNWVVKIDYRDGKGTGDILWRLGPDGDFVITGGTLADFNYGQHYPNLVAGKSAGVFPLMMFDNGNDRFVDAKGTKCGRPGTPACYSRPVLFQLDENANTAQIAWQYKLPAFSACCGSVGILSNGNAEYDIALSGLPPQISTIQEVTMETTPQLVWEMDVTGQLVYRGFRIPSLYPGVEWTPEAVTQANAKPAESRNP